MGEIFNQDEAKQFLHAKEEKEKQAREKGRLSVLQKVISILKKEFEGSHVEVYLIGSILHPFAFSSRSDIDIVLKNFKEDRFDIWAKLERIIERKVEIILFETCRFKDFVLTQGYKIEV